MKILALDVALANTGYAVIDMKDDSLVDTGIITTSLHPDVKKGKKPKTMDQMDRINKIIDVLQKVTYEHRVELGAICAELPTGGSHSAAALEAMSIAKTVVIVFARLTGLDFYPVTPHQVKMTTGQRYASKIRIQIKISKMYPTLRKEYRSTRSKSGFKDDFEHVADAISGYYAAKKEYEALN